MLQRSSFYTILFVFILFFWHSGLAFCSAVTVDRVSQKDTIGEQTATRSVYHLNHRYLIAPALCVSYGITSFFDAFSHRIDLETRQQVLSLRPDRTKIDNYTQYAPVVLTYALNLTSLKGTHSYRDMTIIYSLSTIFTGIFTLPFKMYQVRERPDFSNYHSFPSGHTTTAFSCAQFMFREYQDTHLWLSISGATCAIFTGIARVVNNKHWVSDVVTGAGLGILSTELAYAMYPFINRLLTKKKNKNNFSADRSSMLITPYLQQQGIGLCFKSTF